MAKNTDNTEKKTRNVMCRHFPVDVHKNMKRLALEQDTTLQAIIIRACEELLER